jgi:probable F420-dependent oxidoreductase
MSKRHPFRFGVINEQMKAPSAWFDHVRRVEALGYTTLLLRDHFVPDFFGDQYAPLVALMAAASVTTTLRLGTMVIDNDYRHPVMLAKEAATLDCLSGGRFELGIGAGWLRTEYEQAGLPFDRAGVRIDRLEESIRVMKGIWAEAPTTFAGQHYQVTGMNGVPKPLQRPHPPLLIGGGKERMLKLAGREADIVGILTSDVSSGTLISDIRERMAAAVHQKIDWIRQGAGHRFDQIELSLIPTIIFTDDRRSHIESLIRQQGWDITVEAVLQMPSMLIGSIEEIAQDLQARRESYGFSYYVVADDQMEAFAPVVAQLGGANA